jgi:glucokinase
MADLHLLADVGGTNTRVGLADPGNGLIAGTARSFPNVDFAGLAPLLAAYLADIGTGPIAALCAGVAGPVRGDAAQLTNHDWHITSAALRASTGAAHVHLLNDLQAQALALDDLPPDALTPIRPGTPDTGPRLVLGLGTGCNVAVAHRIGDRLFVPAAESGHSALPHLDPALNALTRHLARDHPHKPIEAALSGPGLQRIYHWHSGTTLDTHRIIAGHATGTDPHATAALTLFSRLLGAVAGNLCLHHMATGGLYLIGGAARATAPHLIALGFDATFAARGPYAAIIDAIPVHLISDDTAALRGCARHLRDALTAP